jgi:TIR domain-containing protein
MKHDPALAKLLVLDARDGGQEQLIAKYPKELVLEQRSRLIDEGMADGKVIRDGSQIRWIKNFRLTTAGHHWLEKLERRVEPVFIEALEEGKSKVRIFISHSSADADMAEALADLLETALRLGPKGIRCTSVVGYALPTGARIEEQLRMEIERSDVLIALITEAALSSTYVLFELGARWVLRKPLFPVLGKGMRAADLKEPLKELVAATCDKRGDVLNLVETLAETLSVAEVKPTTYERAVVRLLATSKRSTTAIPKTTKVDTLPLSAHEIFALQAVFEGSPREMIEEIIGDSLDISPARAHQALESIRRKGLVTCRPGHHGEIEYDRTEQGLAWLVSHTRKSEG